VHKVINNYQLLKIYIHEFFWQVRINFFAIISFNKQLKLCIFELKKNGYVVIPNYFNEKILSKIHAECQFLLNNIELIDNIEKIPGSIKLKNIGKKSFFLNKIQQNFFLKFLAIIYSFKIRLIKNGALLIYSLTHDGKSNIKNLEGSFRGKMIAGDPHLDTPIHELKAFVALNNINKKNGPFVSIKSSNNFNKDLINNYMGMRNGIPNSEIINQNYVDKLIQSEKVFFGTVNRGDLVIIDTRSIHYASSLIEGKREMLWLYY